MLTQKLKVAIEQANTRGVGQFHVWDGMALTTWHSFDCAVAVARKAGGSVYNMDARRVA